MGQDKGSTSGPFALAFPPELVDAIADRVVERLAGAVAQEPSPYLTVDEASEYLRCSKQAVYDRISQGAITPCRDGRRVLLDRRALDVYLRDEAA